MINTVRQCSFLNDECLKVNPQRKADTALGQCTIIRMSIISKGLWWIGPIWVYKAWCGLKKKKSESHYHSCLEQEPRNKCRWVYGWKGGSREKIGKVCCAGQVKAAAMWQTVRLWLAGSWVVAKGTVDSGGNWWQCLLQRWSQKWMAPANTKSCQKVHSVSWPREFSKVSPQSMACM